MVTWRHISPVSTVIANAVATGAGIALAGMTRDEKNHAIDDAESRRKVKLGILVDMSVW